MGRCSSASGLDTADGYAERRAALEPSSTTACRASAASPSARTSGLRHARLRRRVPDRNITPHVAQKTRYSALDARTSKPSGYAISQRIRKRVEEIFGWMKTVGGYRKTRYVEASERTRWSGCSPQRPTTWSGWPASWSSPRERDGEGPPRLTPREHRTAAGPGRISRYPAFCSSLLRIAMAGKV